MDNVKVGDTGPVSFELRAGEMVALAGLRGAGQEEIGRLLFACRTQESGQITLNGVPFTATTPGRRCLRASLLSQAIAFMKV
jgi:ribose transport system ATP-binding protein